LPAWLDAGQRTSHDRHLFSNMICSDPTTIWPGAVMASGIGLLVAFVGTAVVRRYAARIGMLDVPNERSSHQKTTPRGGGIGIVLAAALATVLLLTTCGEGLTAWWGWALWLGALPVVVVSLWDDLRALPAPVRLLVHAGAAAVSLYLLEPAITAAAAEVWALRWQLPGAGSLLFRAGVLVVLLLWIVGMTNVYNFMDGIDGIAGLQALVAGSALGIAGWWSGVPEVLVSGFALAGAAVGFLFWNRPPARIFMGDVGSAFLGYSFAVLPLIAATRPVLGLPERTGADLFAWLALAVAALWPFLFDGVYTFLRRLSRGENVLASHRSHLYQRLVKCGASHATVSALYGGYAAAGAVVGWVAWQRGQTVIWLAAGAVIAVLALRLLLRVWAAERVHAEAA